jgi:hypothetical protein
MRLTFKTSLATVAVVMLSGGGSATAATINDLQGIVQISRNGGPFTTVSAPTECNAGDVVRAQRDGSARVINADGSMQTARPGAPVTCRGMQPSTPQAAPTQSPAANAAASGFGGFAPGLSTGLVVGGVAIAAGAGAAYALTRKNSASP